MTHAVSAPRRAVSGRLGLALVAGLALSGAALADHANPWASEEDEVLSQYHDENQAQSEDTPGEDEMNGVMERRALGKLSDDPAEEGRAAGLQGGDDAGTGGGHGGESGAGESADAGGHGGEGGGHGGGGHGGGHGGAGGHG